MRNENKLFNLILKDLEIEFYQGEMKELASLTNTEFDGGNDNRLFAYEGFNIDVFADQMTRRNYDLMCDDIRDYEIKGQGYEVYACNDISGYHYWRDCTENNEPNYIHIVAVITNLDLVDAEKLKQDLLDCYDHFSHYHNLDSHNFK
jgi:hypothetical protein